MVGDAYRCAFTDCHVTDVVITGASNCGVFVGNATNVTFNNCSASGSINGTGAIGGFVGYTPSGLSRFDACIADVDITGSSWKLGGFAGSLPTSSVLENCAAYGDVTSTMNLSNYNPFVGGFVGENKGAAISNCHAAGTVTSAHDTYSAGGFAGGQTSGSILDCSFDVQKNPGLSGAGTGSLDESAVAASDSSTVLANICRDLYRGHVYENGVCIRCGEQDPDYVPPAQDENVPNTGDNSLVLWLSLAFVVGTGALYALLRRGTRHAA